MTVKIVTFCVQATALAKQIATQPHHFQQYLRDEDCSLWHTDLRRFAQQAIADSAILLWIGTPCQAVGACMPYLEHTPWQADVYCIDPQTNDIFTLQASDSLEKQLFIEQICQLIGGTRHES